MLSEAKTIIKDNQLVGYIRLQDSLMAQLQPTTAILLEYELNKGDTTIITFRLRLIQAEVI